MFGKIREGGDEIATPVMAASTAVSASPVSRAACLAIASTWSVGLGGKRSAYSRCALISHINPKRKQRNYDATRRRICGRVTDRDLYPWRHASDADDDRRLFQQLVAQRRRSDEPRLCWRQ